jgi:hypothetical protein
MKFRRLIYEQIHSRVNIYKNKFIALVFIIKYKFCRHVEF